MYGEGVRDKRKETVLGNIHKKDKMTTVRKLWALQQKERQKQRQKEKEIEKANEKLEKDRKEKAKMGLDIEVKIKKRKENKKGKRERRIIEELEFKENEPSPEPKFRSKLDPLDDMLRKYDCTSFTYKRRQRLWRTKGQKKHNYLY